MARTVAVIGASNTRSKYGNKAVRAFRQQGYTVLPINPHQQEVEGLQAYASVLDVPQDIDIDMATFYVSPDVGLRVIAQVAARRIPEVWFNPGSESPELLARAKAAGLTPIVACSIMGIGVSPAAF